MNGGEDRQLFNNFNGSDDYSSTQRRPDDLLATETNEVRWTASEFIDHQKGTNWFLILAGVGIVTAIAVYFITGGDLFGPIIIGLLAIIFGIGAARHPKVLNYVLDDSGVTIGGHHSPYDEFRSFAVINEGPIESIILLPTKRWSPPLSIYFAPKDAEKIVETLSTFVPFENHQPGIIDRFLHHIHF